MIYCEVLLSTSPRGRELKSDTGGKAQRRPQSTSPRGRELKNEWGTVPEIEIKSTSPRGRELKRLWRMLMVVAIRRPPREVVSWKLNSRCLLCRLWTVDLHERSWVENSSILILCCISNSRPPREVVSWKIQLVYRCSAVFSRPPREVVSWKVQARLAMQEKLQSTSTRGRELKRCCKCNLRWDR